MAILLAVDTTATPVSCAILNEDKVLASAYAHTGLTHSQTLMPMIESALRTASLTVEQIDAFAVSAGPGSFTGVRIGVSTVKGLAFPDDKPCVAVSTLEAMAESVRGLPMACVICCVMDARCHQVYTALFEQDAAGEQARLSPDEAISVGELAERLKKVEKPIIFVGDGAKLCYNELRDELPAAVLAPPCCRYQSAAAVALCGMRRLAGGQAVPPEQLTPFYLRLPQAERELRSRQATARP